MAATKRTSAKGPSARTMGRPRDVDELIHGAPADKRRALRSIRAAIRKAAPYAVEAVAYGGLAQYKYRGRVLLYFGFAKEHVAIYGPIQLFLRSHPELSERYEIDKGTLRLPYDKPVPVAVVAKIVKSRMRELDARS